MADPEVEARDAAIWREYMQGNKTQQEIADEYGLSQSRIARIVHDTHRALGAFDAGEPTGDAGPPAPGPHTG